MRALLIRHAHYPLIGQALGGRADHALSPEGRTQAAALAETLARRPLAAVITSPVRRARETAALIAAAHDLAPEPDDDFAEIDFGAWTGRTFAGLAGDPAWQQWNDARDTAAVPGGEAMAAVQARALRGMARLRSRFPQEEVAIVTHGDVIKAIVLHAQHAPLTAIHNLDIAPGAIAVIEDGKIMSWGWAQ